MMLLEAGALTSSQFAAIHEALLPLVAELVCGVQERDPVAVHQALDPLAEPHLRGLALVLAALVPDDVTFDEMRATRPLPEYFHSRHITPADAARNRARLAAALGIEDDYVPSVPSVPVREAA